MVALKALLTVTVKVSERTVRASLEAMRKPSSGITPREARILLLRFGLPAAFKKELLRHSPPSLNPWLSRVLA